MFTKNVVDKLTKLSKSNERIILH